MTILSGSMGRRPKRQRTPTTLYTDDNPSTFTTKIPKSERERLGLEEIKPPKPSYYFVEEDDDDDQDHDHDDHNAVLLSSPSEFRLSKRSGRKRKPYHKDDMLNTTTVERLEAAAAKQQDPAPSQPAQPAQPQSKEQPPPTILSSAPPTAAAPPVKRKRGRPPKNKRLQSPPVPVPPLTATTTTTSSSSSIAADAVASSNTFNGRNSNPLSAATSAPGATTRTTSLSANNNSTAFASPTRSPSRKGARGRRKGSQSHTKKKKATPLPEHAFTPASHDATGTYLHHAIRMAPILPAELETTANTTTTTTNSHSRITKIEAIKSPQWEPLYQPDVYFDEDYDAETNRLPEDLAPVTRSITCMTTRKPDHAYMAVGDSAGFCTIYALETFIRPIARLETLACQQRARTEQERIREQQKRKRKSVLMDTSQTMVHALGMMDNRVVIATALELECIDIPSQTSLWVCPLGQDRLVTSLDMHPTRHDVLVSCKVSVFDDPHADADAHAAMYGQTSPLMLLQQSCNNIEVCDANAPILLRSPCCTAIWDASINVQDRLLFVVVAGEELELVLVQGASIDSWKVACKTRIPVKQSNHYTRLSQSQQGTYTLVACSRGIRLYQTETLQLIHVYGDQLALHGKSLAWHDCLLLGKKLPSHYFSKSKDSTGNIECDDWIQANDADQTTTTDELGQYVIGVPNYKGAKELTETLHVWKVETASVVPAMSIPLPAKSEGVQALVVAPSTRPGGDRLVLAGRDGEGHVLHPKLVSDFAGIMYPPGYQVITDNVEYIEEEDELDNAVLVSPEASVHRESTNTTANDSLDEQDDYNDGEEEATVNVLDEELDEDLREALRQSLLEQKRQRQKERQSIKDQNVNVLVVGNDIDSNSNNNRKSPSPIPCRPEAYLRQAMNSHSDDSDEENGEELEGGAAADPTSALGSPVKTVRHDPKVFCSSILEALGHANPKKKEGGGEFSFSVTAKVVIASAAPVSIRPLAATGALGGAARHGKRSRSANLEAMLKASIDPKLQRFMISKQALGVSGKGSALRATSTTSKVGENATTATTIAATTTIPFAGATRSNDEAAVALGLLGLSPVNSSHGATTPDNDFASDTASRTSSQPLSETPNVVLLEQQPQQQPPFTTNCLACRGRFVIHTCGKRALPIDYDEVAKVERERKEREEEEKKRMRAEKRRLADQRRREAKKQKQRELEEQRRREGLEQRRRQMEQAASLFATAAGDRRRDLIVASYASHVSSSSSSSLPQPPPPQQLVPAPAPVAAPPPPPVTAAPAMGLTSVNYSQQATPTVAAPSMASPPGTSWERVPAAPAPPPAELSQRATTMATLSSADALVALASFAGTKALQPEPAATATAPPTTNGHAAPNLSGFAAFAAAQAVTTGHGFGRTTAPATATPTSSTSGIPSFAALRGQVGQTTTTTTPFAPATAAGHAFHQVKAQVQQQLQQQHQEQQQVQQQQQQQQQQASNGNGTKAPAYVWGNETERRY